MLKQYIHNERSDGKNGKKKRAYIWNRRLPTLLSGASIHSVSDSSQGRGGPTVNGPAFGIVATAEQEATLL